MSPLRRPNRRWSLSSVFLLPLLLGAALTVAWTGRPQIDSVAVRGEVTNGTEGGSVPGDLALTLHAFSGMDETGIYTTTLTGGTRYRFDGVRLEVGQTAVVQAVYDGVMYVSEFATVESEQAEISLPLTIYETTESPSDVSVTQLHFFVNKLGDRVQVGQYAVVGNAGDRTYIGPASEMNRATWTASLPDGAENLRFDSVELGGRFVATDGGFADTRPVPPGDASVETSFTYELSFREGMEIEQSIDLPVRAAVLVLPEGEWGLEGPEITPEGMLDTQMGTALSYMAGPMAANEPLAFRLVPRETDGAPAAQAASGRTTNDVLIGLGAMVAGGVAATYVWRSTSAGPVPAEVEDDVRASALLH